jgi:hypothetical protein
MEPGSNIAQSSCFDAWKKEYLAKNNNTGNG